MRLLYRALRRRDSLALAVNHGFKLFDVLPDSENGVNFARRYPPRHSASDDIFFLPSGYPSGKSYKAAYNGNQHADFNAHVLSSAAFHASSCISVMACV
jgi:hypothetical protein